MISLVPQYCRHYPGSLVRTDESFAARFKTIALSERIVSQAEYAAIDRAGRSDLHEVYSVEGVDTD